VLKYAIKYADIGLLKRAISYLYLYFTRLRSNNYISKIILYNYSTCCTNCVLTRSVHQVRVHAFGAPTTRLRVWCTYEALTNQGGGASVYRPCSLLYTIDSHHHPKEHTILYVFRAPGYNLLISLS
jgi:hypothetical protein